MYRYLDFMYLVVPVRILQRNKVVKLSVCKILVGRMNTTKDDRDSLTRLIYGVV